MLLGTGTWGKKKSCFGSLPSGRTHRRLPFLIEESCGQKRHLPDKKEAGERKQTQVGKRRATLGKK
ncbi:hypothetical protein MPNT_10383 [Candidatus Methylacidithermus pantelleriae]|uniref:Uncharacterized protein n=1 Tax=Candidatus Methylacidithermus pantelleriae TaxID=2744239 RepID=A0A8J2BHM0_9BACT|nr:hypothetical protein MPNT_10379 [Candidatus Methylacidithermus pantelleriae]CAF0689819.1 hypothetical protein MPNT_10383 [Candidatus Methylacidithermus pantelleriae]